MGRPCRGHRRGCVVRYARGDVSGVLDGDPCSVHRTWKHKFPAANAACRNTADFLAIRAEYAHTCAANCTMRRAVIHCSVYRCLAVIQTPYTREWRRAGVGKQRCRNGNDDAEYPSCRCVLNLGASVLDEWSENACHRCPWKVPAREFSMQQNFQYRRDAISASNASGSRRYRATVSAIKGLVYASDFGCSMTSTMVCTASSIG